MVRSHPPWPSEFPTGPTGVAEGGSLQEGSPASAVCLPCLTSRPATAPRACSHRALSMARAGLLRWWRGCWLPAWRALEVLARPPPPVLAVRCLLTSEPPDRRLEAAVPARPLLGHLGAATFSAACTGSRLLSHQSLLHPSSQGHTASQSPSGIQATRCATTWYLGPHPIHSVLLLAVGVLTSPCYGKRHRPGLQGRFAQ